MGETVVFGIALADGATYLFYEFFEELIPRIDAESCRFVRLFKIGPPKQSGPIHESLRSRSHAQQDEVDAVDFAREVAERGGDAKFVISLRLENALKAFGVDRKSLPGILFLVPRPGRDSRDAVFVRIPLGMCSTSKIRRLLGDTLSEGLSPKAMTDACPRADRIRSIVQTEQVRVHLQNLETKIAELSQGTPQRKEAGRGNAFALVISESGRRLVTESEYDDLIRVATTFDVFVDELSSKVLVGGKVPSKQMSQLSLSALSEAARRKTAFLAGALDSLEQSRDPDQAFRTARRFIDQQVYGASGRQKWRIFKTKSSRGASTSYRLDPDEGVRFAFISTASDP